MTAPRVSTVLIVGLARTGLAVAQRLAAEDVRVIAGDDGDVMPETAGALVEMGATVAAPPDWVSLVADVDLVVPSPGVTPGHPAIVEARRSATPVRSEIDLAAERCPVRFAAVTGTNGKSTVTSLAAAMLDASGGSVEAVGNLGRPFLSAVESRVDALVAEVSSFQLEFVTDAFRPTACAVLAIAADHLDWHETFDRYTAAKARIFEAQRADDLCVYDATDEVATRIVAAAPVEAVGVGSPEGYRVAGDALCTPNGDEIATVADLARALPHDISNALAAMALALRLGATPVGVRRALREFTGLPHRVALVGDAGGVQFYDDSKATNPHATLHAIRSFESVVLIAGGRNKGLDLSTLASARDHLRGVVAMGEAAGDIASAFDGVRPVTLVEDMASAVEAASQMARPGDVVLLSPGCASFDQYSSYAARGDDFGARVRTRIAQEGSLR